MSEPWDWRNQPGDQEPREPGKNQPGGPPPWAAGMLIGIGVVLFLGNLGLLRFHAIWSFWPAVVIAIGISHLMRGGQRNRARPSRHRSDGSRRKNRPQFAAQPPFASPFQQTGSDYQNSLQDFVLFGSLKRKLETLAFSGGNLTSIFGSIEVDFRRAVIPALTSSVVVNTTAVFGSIKLRVPQNWRVHISGMSILGNFEDKTIPPNIGAAAPVLVVSGISLFSSVEIED